MVKVKEGTPLLPDGSIDLQLWLQQLSQKGYFQDMEKIKTACMLGQLAGQDHATETGESCLQQGLAMADVLADLEIDQDTLAAAIIFESVHYAGLSLEDVEEQLGAQVARLVKGIKRMSAISHVQGPKKYPQNKQQLDNIRKMLLAMVDDVRVVLIKLAERLCVLRSSAPMPQAMRQHIATEAMEIYAPLANRLGIGAIKWEMEDLAFRYLHPHEYKSIASGLKSKRLERDEYVETVVKILNEQLMHLSIGRFAVYGRSKHIHSIYRKMSRKNVSLQEIYDATAVRILVQTPAQCYEVLGLVHTLWQQVIAEFDDYIHHPKSNGYQSLHTAVIGPDDKVFEVQIRTFDMHEQAEMGIAAHWKYKEGRSHKKESHERKIAWLREVLAWHREMATHQTTQDPEMEFLEDRVYVFTPDGEVFDLPKEVTPLDFAYYVHTELGHRCRGAKVNHHIVPLTYHLKTGDRVEILTGKEARPSRDWISPHLQYLKTSRAKAKVLHWFKQQDVDKNKIEGQSILDHELKTLGIRSERVVEALPQLGYKHMDELKIALGRGEVKISHIMHRLLGHQPEEATLHHLMKGHVKKESVHKGFQVEGVGQLLTHMARCCRPIPGDAIIGYITVGRGVSVHRKDCKNIIYATERQKQRFLEVSWEPTEKEQYGVDIVIYAFDRTGLLRDITAVLANERAKITALNSKMNKRDNKTEITVSLEITSLTALSQLLARVAQVSNVIEARRHL